MKTGTEKAQAASPAGNGEKNGSGNGEGRSENLSVRELAQALISTPREQRSGQTTVAEAPKGEEAAPNPAPEPGSGPEAAPETEAPETAPAELPEAAPEETRGRETTEDEHENEHEQEEEPKPELTPGKAGLPEELADAMELAKGDGKKGVAKLLGRVHRLVDERDTERNARLAAAEENQQLRAEVQQLRAGAGTRDGANAPAPNVWNPEAAAVTGELANVDHWLDWCDAHPEGGEVATGEGKGAITLDGRQVSAVQRDLQRQRTELVARKVQSEASARQAYQARYAEAHGQALAEYPWLKDPNAPERVELNEIVRVFPSLKQSPDWELAMGDFLAGKALRLQKGNALKLKPNGNGNGALRKVAAAREPAQVLANAPAGGRPAKRGENEEQEAAAAGEFARSGRVSDLARTFAAQARARRGK